MIHKLRTMLFLSMISQSVSCEKFVEADPPITQIVNTTVFSNEETAIAAINGIYSRMISSNGFASGSTSSITFLAGYSSDELQNHSIDINTIQFYSNALLATNSTINASLWSEPYQYIYTANLIIEGLTNSTINTATREQLSAEAKFIRAFCNFYLVSFFGDIPLSTTTDFEINNSLGRTDRSFVFKQIITDLLDAENSLPTDFGSYQQQRSRPTKWAATGLLARVYLYLGDWVKADSHATTVIENNLLFTLEPDLNAVFKNNSREAIWQLVPNTPGFNTNEGRYFILNETPNLATLSSTLLNSFANNDKRKKFWIDSIVTTSGTHYYPAKYKIREGNDLEEYSMVLRLAELYLIRAEARAHQNFLIGSLLDLNSIRKRAGLPEINTGNQEILLLAVEDERQAELFTEWGHRWLDLKRTGRANEVLSGLKSPNWQPPDTLYPIPQSMILNNSNVRQNPGY